MTSSPPQIESGSNELRLGVQVARLLREVQTPTTRVQRPTSNVKSLEELTALLMSSGVGAYGWLHVSDSEFADTDFGRELHDVYRQQRLSARRHEQDIVAVINLLRSAEIEPVLVKGWAIARHYEDPALRPYGDIDLCVSPAQFAKAAEVLRRVESVDGPFVDLHSGFNRIGVGKRLSHLLSTKTEAQREWDEIYSRSRLVSVSNVQRPTSNVSVANEDVGLSTLDVGQGFQVRVLSDEDHLRVLCVHMLRSGARRPTWLCDVAVMLRAKSAKPSSTSNVQRPTSAELRPAAHGQRPTWAELRPESKVQRPKSSCPGKTLDVGRWTLAANFDWEKCLSGDSVDANYVATAVLLAHELLGVDISHTPFANRQLPRWIVEETLRQWGGKSSPTCKVQSLRTQEGRWTLDFGLWTNAFRRWDNPIRATAAVNGKFSDRPRLRYRLAELIARLPEVPDHWQVMRARRPEQRSAIRSQRVASTIAR